MVRAGSLLFAFYLVLVFQIGAGHAAGTFVPGALWICDSDANCGGSTLSTPSYRLVTAEGRSIVYCDGQLIERKVHSEGEWSMGCRGKLTPIEDFSLAKATEKMMSLDTTLRHDIKTVVDTLKQESAKQLTTSLEKLPTELLQTAEFQAFAREIRCQVLKELDEANIKGIDLTSCK